MLKRVVGLTLAALLGCAFFATQAAAAPVQCGDVITEDLTLEADLTDCPDDGLVVGADRITIDLNGHDVSSECREDECIDRVGIDNSGGFDRVRIRNGRVAGFEQTIRLERANRNTLADLEVDGGVRGLDPSMSLVLDHSHRNLIKDSAIVGGDPAGTVLLASDHNKFVRSLLGGGGVIDIRNGDGIQILDGSDANTLTTSTVGGSGSSVVIADSARNSFKRSSADGHFAAVIVSDADRTLIAGNELNGGQGWSILARGDRNTFRDNDAVATMQLEGNRNLLASNRIEAAAFDSSEIRLSAATGT